MTSFSTKIFGGFFYCVLNLEGLLREVSLHTHSNRNLKCLDKLSAMIAHHSSEHTVVTLLAKYADNCIL